MAACRGDAVFNDPADMAWLRRCLEEKPPGRCRTLNAIAQRDGGLCEAQTCRRLVLLNYFGEGRQEPCGNCDICLESAETVRRFNGTRVRRCRRFTASITRFGMGDVVEVLRGANNQRIRDMGHDKLPSSYGIGREQSHEHWGQRDLVSLFI